MQLVDEILSDNRMEKMDKIERLEAILSAATTATSASSPSASLTLSSSELSERAIGSGCCACDCHSGVNGSVVRYIRDCGSGVLKSLSEIGSQTLSTGDIVITKVFFPPEGDASTTDICLTPSPKKAPKTNDAAC